MTPIKTFCKYAGVLMVMQGITWFAVSGFPPAVRSPAPDFLFEVVVLVYYPGVWLVEGLGRFTGESNLVTPIWFGVPLGIFLYSIALAAVIMFAKRTKH